MSESLVIGELRSRGLWDDARACRRQPAAGHLPKSSNTPKVQNDSERTAAALRLWHSAVPAEGRAAETYLRSRGIDLAIPASIRFHPHLKHLSGGTWPGMVALVTRGCDDEPLAIHRTYLSRDGSGKAPVTPQKMMLGPCRGSTVRLAVAAGKLMVGEGVETCFAAMQTTGLPAWAARFRPRGCAPCSYPPRSLR